jgi:YD repeat-containing protein
MNEYDALGREPRQYLPYPASPTSGGQAGRFRRQAFAEQQAYYNTAYQDQTPFSKTDFEASPLNRPTATYAPGNSWAGANVGVALQQGLNTLDDDVRMTSIVNGLPVFGNAYPAGSLYKTTATDEAGNKTVEYKDNAGLVLLKKVQQTANPSAGQPGWLCTYYVYDEFDRLAFVAPPKAVEQLTPNQWGASGWQLTGNVAAELCYIYLYDDRGRLISKQLPGAKPVYLCYDKRDRLVFAQDGNQRNNGQWLVTFYDGLNRPTATALYHTTQTQQQLQASLDVLQPMGDDNPVPTLPDNQLTRLSATWYDDYTMPGTAAYSNGYVATAQSNIATGDEQPDVLPRAGIVRGQVTGTRTKVLNNPGITSPGIYAGVIELTTTIYYDEKGRALQTHATNHTGGTDISTVVYSFTGKPLSALLVHSNPSAINNPRIYAGGAGVTVATRSTYHNDFLLKTEKQINGGQWKRINQLEYDIMGKPVKKWMGDPSAGLPTGQAGMTGGTSGFYVAMSYNIRGWLTGINKADHETLETNPASTTFYNAIFSEVISYDQGFTTPQLNGNIAGVKWAAAGDRQARAYGYEYDRLNRLTKADFTQQSPTSGGQGPASWDVSAGIDYSVSNLTYDANGNLLTLQQKGWKLGALPNGQAGSNWIDQLTYGYFANGNRLQGVTDMSNDNASKLGDFRYDPATKTATDYAYDDNGNLTQDNNKKIASIQYNHLNLPQLITLATNSFGAPGGTVAYTYDAAGNKLRKTVTDNAVSPAKVTVTDYIGGFVYENNQLQYLGHEEGRVRWAKKYYAGGRQRHDLAVGLFLQGPPRQCTHGGNRAAGHGPVPGHL